MNNREKNWTEPQGPVQQYLKAEHSCHWDTRRKGEKCGAEKIFEEINERIINEAESLLFENISKIDKHFNQIDKKKKKRGKTNHKPRHQYQ